MELNYYPIKYKNDNDLEELIKYHNLPEIKKYISLSGNFFDYVINNKNVFYLKIKIYNDLVVNYKLKRILKLSILHYGLNLKNKIKNCIACFN